MNMDLGSRYVLRNSGVCGTHSGVLRRRNFLYCSLRKGSVRESPVFMAGPRSLEELWPQAGEVRFIKSHGA